MNGWRAVALICTTGALACAVVAGATGALPSSVFDAQVSMDTVDIRVESGAAGRTLILDDEKLPYDIAVQNRGQDCYIRVKVLCEAKGSAKPVAIECPDDGRWHAGSDGWTYYRPVLLDGESVTLSTAIGNPVDDWDGSGFPVHAYAIAQAVQADNITPDYASEAPWGDTQAHTTRYFRVRN